MHFISLVAIATLPLAPFIAASSIQQQQQQIVPQPQIIFEPSTPAAGNMPGPLLSDLLTSKRDATIFYDYIRSSSLDLNALVSDRSSYTTLLVPTNKAIIALPYKPHLGRSAVLGTPREVFASERDEEEAHRAYLEKWIERHVVVDQEVDETGISGDEYKTMVEGEVLRFVEGDEGVRVLPGDVGIVAVLKAANGKIIFLNGVLPLNAATA